MNVRLASYRDGHVDLAFPVQGNRVTIGREDDNEIQLPHEKVSKHHALLQSTPTGWLIQDLSSTNGILVNGKPVREAALQHGDHVQIGPYELHFETKALSEDWVPSYVMDFSTKVHDQTIQFRKTPEA